MPSERRLLTEAEREAFLAEHPLWRFEAGALRRAFAFQTYLDGARFVSALAEVAEAKDHHPELDLRWRKVWVSVSTHEPLGLTPLDIALAKEADRLSREHHPAS